MAKKKHLDTKIVIGAIALAVGLPIAGTAALQQQTVKNFASTKSSPIKNLPNLNEAKEITKTINKDGTMGPESYQGNYSFKQPSSVKGNVAFKLVGTKGNPGKTQPVTSLKLTITKAEVHLAQQKEKAKEKEIKAWETLLITNPTIIDITEETAENLLTATGVTQLAAGKYTEIRFYVNAAQVTFADGKTSEVFVLPNDKTIRIVQPFSIEEGKATDLKFTLNLDDSVVKAGDTYLLKPVIGAMEEVKE